MASVIVQGINCTYRDLQDGEWILYENLSQDEQFFKRDDPPFTDKEIDDLAERTHQYTSEQAKWKETEDWRFDNGVYAYINGKLKYIPGSYWCYINYWYLEDGEHPDYREDEREFALFLEHCAFRTPLYGATRPKGRRQGATSFGAFFEWFIAGRKEFKNVGTVSFNDDAAKDVFTNMIMPGFKAMLPCFQAEFDSPDDGKSFLYFRKPIEKGRKKTSAARKREGLNSQIDYKSLTLNSYTNKRLSFLLLDEFGRWEKLDCNIYWSKVSKALRKGKKKVGFAYLPTVVNPKDKGGENYKRFYEKSDQRKYGMDTPTGCVIFIMYGTQCYAGCIDKFGESVIDDPAEPIMGNDGEWITEGSKTIILRERALLDGAELMEHRRDFPVDEYDIFAFETGSCEFNEKRIIHRIQELKSEPVYLRKGRLIEKKETVKSLFPGKEDKTERKIEFMDDQSGDWLIYEWPKKPNDFEDYGDSISPRNMISYAAGVDTFRIGFAEDGSKGTICIFKKSNVLNGRETGCYPVAMYCGRPRLIQFLYDEIIKACMWYGCKVNIEISAGDFYYGYFHEKGCSEILYWTPARDPNNPKQKIKPGTETASPFELAAQLEAAKIFFDGNDPNNYNGHTEKVVFPELLQQALNYTHDDRTPYDLVISLMMALLPVLKPQPYETVEAKPKQLLPTFKIESYN